MSPISALHRRPRTGSWKMDATRRAFSIVTALVCLGLPVATAAPKGPAFKLVVHPSVSVTSLDRAFVADVFLKKRTRWSDDELIRPVDLRGDSATRKRFSEDVLKRSVAAVRAYWQQRIFSGRDTPPPELHPEAAVVRYVAQYPGAIGYVSPELETDGVRVITLR